MTLVVTDAAANLAATNITTTRSDVTITTDFVWWDRANGTVSDPDYDVWVNGVQADVYEYGAGIVWYVEPVPKERFSA